MKQITELRKQDVKRIHTVKEIKLCIKKTYNLANPIIKTITYPSKSANT